MGVMEFTGVDDRFLRTMMVGKCDMNTTGELQRTREKRRWIWACFGGKEV
jgi:hypothetical protein